MDAIENYENKYWQKQDKYGAQHSLGLIKRMGGTARVFILNIFVIC